MCPHHRLSLASFYKKMDCVCVTGLTNSFSTIKIFFLPALRHVHGPRKHANTYKQKVGVPGAFTPTCSSQAPGYIEKYDEFKAKGINEIYIITVNDTFVTKCVLCPYFLRARTARLSATSIRYRFSCFSSSFPSPLHLSIIFPINFAWG